MTFPLLDWIVQIQAHILLPDGALIYEGWRFRPPFICMCCGCEVDAVQWAYGRTCGKCDTGRCQRGHRGHRRKDGHPRPEWVAPSLSREEQIARFAEFVEAIPQ